MSFTINTQASDAIVAAAQIIEDLGAASRHKLAADNYKGRKALAGYIRDKKAELEAILQQIGATAEVMTLIGAAIAVLRKEYAEAAKAAREYRERLAAERALTEAMLSGDERDMALAA